jgi:acetyl-CoA carboxylase biotin carboxyl carrier protein
MNMKSVKELGARMANGGKPKSAIDSAAIRELSELLNETGLTEIEIEQNGMRLRVSRGMTHAVSHPAPVIAAAAPVAAAAAPAEAAKPSGPAAGAVPSPMVGTVYVAPEPGKPPFVKVGDTVKEGATLMIIEAMKTMNPITAPRAGTVKEICVKDAQPVEFGQSLVILA